MDSLENIELVIFAGGLAPRTLYTLKERACEAEKRWRRQESSSSTLGVCQHIFAGLCTKMRITVSTWLDSATYHAHSDI